MIQSLQGFFDRHLSAPGPKDEAVSEKRLRMATAALFVEMIRVDFEVTPEERASLEREVQSAMDLSEVETKELIVLAEEEAAESVELFQFTRLIDKATRPNRRWSSSNGCGDWPSPTLTSTNTKSIW